MSGVLIAPSILSADFGNLERDVRRAEDAGADWIHVDVMDGHFVPNLTIGADVARAVRSVTSLEVDVHLMIEDPDRLIPDFVRAGAHRITVHQEACVHLHRTIEAIQAEGVKAGVAINPATPVDALAEIVSYADLVLVMTVEPGFSGQPFIRTSPRKVARLRELLEVEGRASDVRIQVDGGVGPGTAADLVRAGATVLVAGSAVFDAEGGPAVSIPGLREASRAGRPTRAAGGLA